MKIIHPNGKASKGEMAELLEFALECRRRVREQILRIDDTFGPHDFAYRDLETDAVVTVLTPEEQQYPAFAALRPHATQPGEQASEPAPGEGTQPATAPQARPPTPSTTSQTATTTNHRQTSPLKEDHLVVLENTKGWSYRRLFGDYLRGATGIIIRDPYIRAFYQTRNLVEFLRMVNEIIPAGEEVTIHLVTRNDIDQESIDKQNENLTQVQDSFAESSTPFSWEIDPNPNFHARSITTNHGWKITLDRGLDIFKQFEFSALKAESSVQEARMMKGCEINYVAIKP
jgi:ATP-dependent Lon protease